MIADTLPKILAYIRAVEQEKNVECFLEASSGFYLHPTNITQIVNIFSASVLGATLPKPTDVSDVKVK
jgi:hypothetical protein